MDGNFNIEGVIIASAGLITAIVGGLKVLSDMSKRRYESRQEAQRSDVKEFSELLQGYKDLKGEYEKQVKDLKQTIRQMKEDHSREIADLQEQITRLQQGQKKIKKEVL